MNPTLKDFIWCIRLFPNDWKRPNHYVIEDLFFYNSDEDTSYSKAQMGAAIPEKILKASKEDIEYVRENWETLSKNNTPVVFYENGNWGVDLSDVEVI